MMLIEHLEPRTLLSSWYVSPSGAAANPGTARKPFATIQQAANAAQPGDTVFVRGGTYRETVTPPRSGTPGKPITFRPVGRQRVIIDGADPVTTFAPAAAGYFRRRGLPIWETGTTSFFLTGR